MKFVLLEDFRIRFAADPILCGDRVTGQDGLARIVYRKLRGADGRVYLLTAPEGAPDSPPRESFLANPTGEYSSDWIDPDIKYLSLQE